MTPLVPALLAACAVAPAVSHRRAVRGQPAPARPRVARVRAVTPRVGVLAGLALGGCLAAAGLGAAGLAAGAVAAVGLWHLIGRLEPAHLAPTREALAAGLPWALDLLAATAAAGAAPADGLAAVAAALGGSTSLATRLRTVAGQLALGADPRAAWAPALADGGDALAPVCEAYAAAAADGSHLAARLAGQAAAAREQRGAVALAAAHRAGVRAVLPLGLCYLPAFVLLGIVPVVAAALHRL